MSVIRRFEDLIAWQKARKLPRAIYLCTRRSGFARDFGLSGQIQRAAVSVMSNIAKVSNVEAGKNFISFSPLQRLLAQKSDPDCMLLWTSVT